MPTCQVNDRGNQTSDIYTADAPLSANKLTRQECLPVSTVQPTSFVGYRQTSGSHLQDKYKLKKLKEKDKRVFSVSLFDIAAHLRVFSSSVV